MVPAILINISKVQKNYSNKIYSQYLMTDDGEFAEKLGEIKKKKYG